MPVCPPASFGVSGFGCTADGRRRASTSLGALAGAKAGPGTREGTEQGERRVEPTARYGQVTAFDDLSVGADRGTVARPLRPYASQHRRKRLLVWSGYAVALAAVGLTVAPWPRSVHRAAACPASRGPSRKLEIHGDLPDKEYDIEAGRSRVARVSRKWFRLLDPYAVDVAEGAHVPLILAIAVCADPLSAEEHESDETYGDED